MKLAGAFFSSELIPSMIAVAIISAVFWGIGGLIGKAQQMFKTGKKGQ